MNKKKTVINILLIVILMGFALWFALHKDAEEVFALLQDVHIGYLLLVMGAALIYYGLSGWILKLIAVRYQPQYTLMEGITCAYSSALFNGITPVGCGQIAQSYIFRKQKISIRDGVGILWLDFIIYQSVILIYVFALLLLKFLYYYEVHSRWFLLVIAGFLINSFVIVALSTMVSFPSLYSWLSHHTISLAHRLHLVKEPNKVKAKWEEQMRCFREQITIMKNDHRLVIKLVMIQFLRMSIFYILPFFAALAIRQTMEVSQILDILAMSAFVHMLNALTPLPGDSGWSESAFVIIFSTMFSWSSASAIMLVWRFSTFHLILIVGAVLFLVQTNQRFLAHKERKLKQNKERILNS